jgi:sorbitol-specific phosphotransferase system component IIC
LIAPTEVKHAIALCAVAVALFFPVFPPSAPHIIIGTLFGSRFLAEDVGCEVIEFILVTHLQFMMKGVITVVGLSSRRGLLPHVHSWQA